MQVSQTFLKCFGQPSNNTISVGFVIFTTTEIRHNNLPRLCFSNI